MKKEKLNTSQTLLRKPKKLWWRRLVWIFAGMILGIGSVAGTALIMGTVVKSGDLISMTGLNPDEILTEEYQQKTLTQLIISLTNGTTSFNNLDDISRITPYVDTILDQANSTLDEQFGFTFDKDELYSKSWADIGEYALDTVYSGVKLAKVINIDSDSQPALRYLAFEKDEYGNYDYTKMRSIKDLQTQMDTLVADAQIKDLVDVGTSGVIYNLRNCHIGTIASEIETFKINELIDIPSGSPKAMIWVGNQVINGIVDAFNGATVADLIDIDPTNPFMNAIADCTIVNLPTEIMSKTLGELTDNSDVPPMLALKDYTVSDLASGNIDLNNIVLGQLVDIDPTNTILYALRDSTVGSIDDTAKHTVIGSLFSQTELENNRILYALRDYTLANIQEGIGYCHLDDFIDIDVTSSSTPKLIKYLVENEIPINGIMDSINEATIADIVDVGSSGILYALRDYTLNNIDQGFNALTLGDVIEIGESSPQILKSLQNTTIINISSVFDTLTIADMVEPEAISSSPVLTALSGYTLSNFSSGINDLTLGSVLGITDDNIDDFPRLIANLRNCKINEIPDTINTIPLKQMVDITEEKGILYALRNTTLNSLQQDLGTLKLGDYFDYTDPDIQNNRYLGHIDPNLPLDQLGYAIQGLKFEEVYGDLIFNGEDTPQGAWKFMLCRKEGGTWVHVGENYTIASNMPDLLDNMNYNVSAATLFELKDAGLINVTDAKLNQYLMGTTTKIGDCTISDIINNIPTY